MEFSFEVLIVVGLISLFAALIHGIIGFGFPIVATPLLALVTDIQTAIILTLIPTLFVNLVSLASEGNILFAFRRYFSLAFLAMVGSAIGTYILIFTNSEIFKALLAIAIIIYLLADRIKLNFSWVREYPIFSKFTFGILAGILGGLTNVMAPVLIIYSMESKLSKSGLIQALNTCFLLGKGIQLFLFSINGKFTLNDLSISSIMLIVASLALYAGINIKNKIKVSVYIKILRALLLILAVILLIQVSI